MSQAPITNNNIKIDAMERASQSVEIEAIDANATANMIAPASANGVRVVLTPTEGTVYIITGPGKTAAQGMPVYQDDVYEIFTRSELYVIAATTVDVRVQREIF